MGSYAIALDGMSAAMGRFEKAASQMAKAGSSEATAGDVVDLSAEMVALLESKNAYTADVKVAATIGEMEKSTISLLG